MTDGRPEDESQECDEQDELLSKDQTVMATKLQSEPVRQKKNHSYLSHSLDNRGDENAADGAASSRLASPPPIDFVYVDSPGSSYQTSAVPACPVRTSSYSCFVRFWLSSLLFIEEYNVERIVRV
jgi:hypothetical protein